MFQPQSQPGPGPMAYMMVINWVDRWTRQVTDTDIFQIPKAISQMTLGRSRILFVYENLFKTFGFYLYHVP